MKIGVFSALYGDRSWEEACKAISEYGVKAVEAGSGGVIGKYHVHPQEFLKDRAKRKRFIHTAKKYGLEISALSAHGNPLHPDKEFSKAHSDDLKAISYGHRCGQLLWGMPRRRRRCKISKLDHLSLAHIFRGCRKMAMGRKIGTLLEGYVKTGKRYRSKVCP